MLPAIPQIVDANRFLFRKNFLHSHGIFYLDVWNEVFLDMLFEDHYKNTEMDLAFDAPRVLCANTWKRKEVAQSLAWRAANVPQTLLLNSLIRLQIILVLFHDGFEATAV